MLPGAQKEKHMSYASSYKRQIIFTVITAACGIGMVLCVAGSKFLASTYAATLLMCVFLLAVLWWSPQFYPKYLQFIFAVVTDIVGCLSCELVPADLVELGVASQFYGSAPLLIFGRWIFVVAILAFDRRFGVEKVLCSENNVNAVSQPSALAQSMTWLLNFAFFIVVTMCFARVITKPAFLLGVDRFKYGSQYLTGFWSSATRWLGYLVVIPLIAIRMKQIPLSVANIGIYCMYMLWTGNKFGAFFSLLCMVMYAFYDKLYALGRQGLSKLLAVLVFIMALLVAGTVSIEVVTHGFDPVQYLAGRTAQQGQLWWKVYGTYEPASGFVELETETREQIEGLLQDKTDTSQNIGSQYGIYKIMYLSTDTGTVGIKLASGSRYTEAGFPAAYYYCGAVGVVLFAALSAAVAFLFTDAMIRLFVSLRAPTAIIVNKVMSAAATMLSMSIYYLMFTPGCILSYLLLVAIWYFRRRDDTLNWL